MNQLRPSSHKSQKHRRLFLAGGILSSVAIVALIVVSVRSVLRPDITTMSAERAAEVSRGIMDRGWDWQVEWLRECSERVSWMAMDDDARVLLIIERGTGKVHEVGPEPELTLVSEDSEELPPELADALAKAIEESAISFRTLWTSKENHVYSSICCVESTQDRIQFICRRENGPQFDALYVWRFKNGKTQSSGVRMVRFEDLRKWAAGDRWPSDWPAPTRDDLYQRD